jgi:hypothetical protein
MYNYKLKLLHVSCNYNVNISEITNFCQKCFSLEWIQKLLFHEIQITNFKFISRHFQNFAEFHNIILLKYL